jgi:hypothetical protein
MAHKVQTRVQTYMLLKVKFGEQLIIQNNGLKFFPKVDVWSFAMMFKNSH